MKVISMPAILLLLSYSACSTTPTAPQLEALVGFRAVVDTVLLRSLGVSVVRAYAVPPLARVRGTAASLGMLDKESSVTYVLRLTFTGDTAVVFIAFRDRPTTADSLTEADRAAVADAGGRIRFIFDITPTVSASVPRDSLERLAANPAVFAIWDASGKVEATVR